MSAESEFFLGSKSSVALIETLQISHTSFSRSYFLVRNVAAGIALNVPDLSLVGQFFQYYPMKITDSGIQQNMDQGFNITVGDTGGTLNEELDRIETAGTFNVKPTVIYRAWRSDLLNAPLYGPIPLQINNLNIAESSATFEASAPRLNVSGTGEIYNLARFPMLRGSL